MCSTLISSQARTTFLTCLISTLARINAAVIVLLQGQHQPFVARKVMQSCSQKERKTGRNCPNREVHLKPGRESIKQDNQT